MPRYHHDPQTSSRNHKRIRFIKGLYQTWYEMKRLYDSFEESGEASHDQINDLLETQLRVLKDLSHDLYRMPESQELEQRRQRVLDRILGELWHELDKARDNARLLETYHGDPDQILRDDDKTLQALRRLNTQVISTAQRELPILLRRAKRMMDKLVPLFEAILHLYHDNDVVLRTIYFERPFFERVLETPVLEHFFRLIHGSVGEGYSVLIESLLNTRHFEQAEAAIAELHDKAHTNPRLRPYLKRAEASLKQTRLDHQASIIQ
ncbi:MAG: hypothetical protein GC154_17455 [bacterium]|nr:hypothetical protein [bacterium]